MSWMPWLILREHASKAAVRCAVSPASPQCGRNSNVESPRSRRSSLRLAMLTCMKYSQYASEGGEGGRKRARA